jgi:hypothetical protein
VVFNDMVASYVKIRIFRRVYSLSDADASDWSLDGVSVRRCRVGQGHPGASAREGVSVLTRAYHSMSVS